MMTKKHFQLFAEMLAKVENEEEREKLMSWLFPVFKLSNFRFNEEKFKEFVKRRLEGESLKGLNANPKYLYN